MVIASTVKNYDGLRTTRDGLSADVNQSKRVCIDSKPHAVSDHQRANGFYCSCNAESIRHASSQRLAGVQFVEGDVLVMSVYQKRTMGMLSW